MGGKIDDELLIPEEPPIDSPQTMLEKIIEYVITSPENINANVLRSMLYEFGESIAEMYAYMYNNSDESNESGEPDEPNPGDIVDIHPGGAK